ncbi:PIN domain-containing protein [Leptospira sp. 2 VSF19]|uniref:PIN domain-containing protein n=1 Tax=Leptospira soteropolitanensis TaxID=2950025 RepID=A0AAW5VIE5_9LEPT|nr:PIN domain-containing protein [Leptospira soteropolitanensis]MCW7494726.1 PIN domain-containing protein [Leptospira soteropolitanensis]MCW7502282.1 PIN domain-containing protein [Leptospira soteropolitanensis]MCW7524558.1 PIN domain-containing protein [Leptospira soteropolitanensis]MCW7528425.1 PIN domain-containing protein [Leptospira soteropolitanensis]MCW7532280.1 PIN domain-containing protein [Leptospira soteropolitanensis]
MIRSVYLDSDIIIDYLYAREPFFQESVQLISLIENKQIKGSISSLIVWNIFYILAKYTNEKTARELIKEFITIIEIIPIDEKIINQGLNSSIKDFEDSIQYFAAKSKKIEYLITRNKKDYTDGEIKPLSPKEFLTIFKEIT